MAKKISFLIIVFIALCLRLYGINWDQSLHLHPDERFLTMVTSSVKIPKNIGEYFDSLHSPMNPQNQGYDFYVYGTFPLLITRFVGELFGKTGYNEIFLIGRYFSAFMDILTVIIVYQITYLMFKKKTISLYSGLCYALSVLPIQQSHFYTTDSFLVFFSTLAILIYFYYFNTKSNKWLLFASGIIFGLTLASKISLIIVLPLYLLGILFPKKKSLFNIVLSLFVFLIGVFLSFRIFQPYAFDSFLHLSNNFVKNINTARQMITGDFDYPPNIQWAYTIPLYHPLKNILLWGLGLPLSIITFLGVVFLIKTSKKRELLYQLLFITFFVIIIFLYQGIQLAKYMRYFYPIYPLLAIFSGYFISIVNKQKSFLLKILVAVLVASWPLCFIKIYSQPHTRYTASNWIYHHLPIGSKIIAEEWDDSLPISLNQDFYSELYSIKPLNFYEPETTKKWEKITQTINEADYIILSSNRQYGSIPKFPTRYLVASLYYSLLFREKLGFKKIAEFTSYPVFNDDQAEESFTVYDHPKVIVFAKNHFNPELLRRLTNQKLINKAIYLNPKSTM